MRATAATPTKKRAQGKKAKQVASPNDVAGAKAKGKSKADELEGECDTRAIEPQDTATPTTLDLNQPLYPSFGKWAFANGKDLKQVEAIMQLSHGAQAEVWYNSAVVDGSERFDYIAKRWNVWSEWRGFYAEIYLYKSSKHLRLLQGDVVPSFIGIYNVLGGFVSFAMEPLCPVGWNEASDRMSQDLKEKVVEAFEKLHAKGILHNDVELRHMLISDDRSRVMLIDFQESRSLNPVEAVGLQECAQEELEKEMKTVKLLIDYDGSQAVRRRRTNRWIRNFRRGYRRKAVAGNFEMPEDWRETPRWLKDASGEVSDDEPNSDDEWAETFEPWFELMRDAVSGNTEPEEEALGRRFVVPTEAHRQYVRDKEKKRMDIYINQRKRREEMERTRADAERAALGSTETSQSESQVLVKRMTKSSDVEETTDQEPPPAEIRIKGLPPLADAPKALASVGEVPTVPRQRYPRKAAEAGLQKLHEQLSPRPRHPALPKSPGDEERHTKAASKRRRSAAEASPDKKRTKTVANDEASDVKAQRKSRRH